MAFSQWGPLTGRGPPPRPTVSNLSAPPPPLHLLSALSPPKLSTLMKSPVAGFKLRLKMLRSKQQFDIKQSADGFGSLEACMSSALQLFSFVCWQRDESWHRCITHWLIRSPQRVAGCRFSRRAPAGGWVRGRPQLYFRGHYLDPVLAPSSASHLLVLPPDHQAALPRFTL